MSQQVATFSSAEYHRRLSATRLAMLASGLDALFVTDPSNIAWLTGYDGWSFYVHQGVIVSLSEDPVWWGRRMDVNGALRTVWMEDARCLGYSDDLVQSTSSHPMQDLAAVLTRMGHMQSRIGVEMENYYYSAKAHAVLCSEMGQATIVDATALVNWQRTIKSAEELTFIGRAARISDKIILTAIDRAEPGKRKNDLVAEITQAALQGVDDTWGDYPAIVPMLPSGADASAPHLTWNGDVLRRGEGTFFELAGCYRRYHAPLCRTVFLGTPPQEILSANAALLDGLEAGLDAARAGNRACDIANALGSVLERAGIERGARCGYAIGLSYPPDWGERTISLRASDQTELRPGMTFHFMPGLWMKDWGIETTETILITDSGPAEALCTVPRQLFIKD